jgi:ATP-dependent DNA helicase DinG
VLDDLLLVLDELGRGIGRVRAIIDTDQKLVEALAEQLVELNGLQNRIDMCAAALRTALVPRRRPCRWCAGSSGAARRSAAGCATSRRTRRPSSWPGCCARRSSIACTVHVLTSATLTTRDGFGFLRGRLGIDSGVRVARACTRRRSTSSADAARGADGRAGQRGAAAALRRGRGRHHRGPRAADGWRAVRAVHVVQARCARCGGAAPARHAARWPLFVQGEAPRAALLQRFTDADRGILLGVASFWEGVDVPGDPLRGLIITKLPFKVPSEPLTAARIEAIDAMAATASTTTCCRTPRCG